jgi:hypothetical protein
MPLDQGTDPSRLNRATRWATASPLRRPAMWAAVI